MKRTQPIFSHSLRPAYMRQPTLRSWVLVLSYINISTSRIVWILILLSYWKWEGCLRQARCVPRYSGRVEQNGMMWPMPDGNTRQLQPNELKPIHFEFPSQTVMVIVAVAVVVVVTIFTMAAHVHTMPVSVTSARSIVYCVRMCLCFYHACCWFLL